MIINDRTIARILLIIVTSFVIKSGELYHIIKLWWLVSVGVEGTDGEVLWH